MSSSDRFRFDLEKALATWRHVHARRRVFLKEDLDELECHLRDHVAYLIAGGLDEEAAFQEAVRALGDLDGGEAEYRKVRWGKLRRRGEVLHELYWRAAMWKNYFIVALRNLRRHPGYAFINVFGLAVGMACCLLILLYVRHELSYDRFHEKSDRIQRIVLRGKIQDREMNAPISPAPMAPELIREIPEVEAATRLFTLADQVLVERRERQFVEKKFYYADSFFFDVFTFEAVSGDLKTALREPNTIVLTESAAKRYFPEGGAVGQSLRVMDTSDYRVTAVTRDLPPNAHFHFDLLATMTAWPPAQNALWINNNMRSYLLLRPGADPAAVEAKIQEVFKKNAGQQMQDFMNTTFEELEKTGNKFTYELQPLTDIHLHSHLEFEIEPNGNIAYVYIFSAVGFFILLIASINFMNLATARSAERAKEVGIRKVVGSTRGALIRQFLAESVVMSVAALVFALIFVTVLLPVFNGLTGKEITYTSLLTPLALAALVAITVVVGLLSGGYPAFFLSSFEPVTVLKGRFSASPRGALLRSGLVVLQFVISIALMVGTLVVYNQLRFVREKSLGFDKEHVAVIRRADVLGRQQDAFQGELRQDPDVAAVSASTEMTGALSGLSVYRKAGEESGDHLMALLGAHYGWAEAMGMELKAGRFFSKEFPTDSTAFVINEAAARKFGWKNPVGQKITFLGPDLTGEIIGVLKDFHFASLHDEINPLVINFAHARALGPLQPLPYIVVRLKPGDPARGLAAIERQWNAFAPGQPLDISFLDAEFDKLYREEQQVGQVFTGFAVIAIVIACLGLFGLAAFTAQQRTKEIGVRKVLGASVSSIVGLLSTDFLKLVGIAFLVAAPLAYFAMERWLDGFAYRIEIGPGVFVLTGALVLLVALLTVSYQSVKAALADPVKSLRYE